MLANAQPLQTAELVVLEVVLKIAEVAIAHLLTAIGHRVPPGVQHALTPHAMVTMNQHQELKHVLLVVLVLDKLVMAQLATWQHSPPLLEHATQITVRMYTQVAPPPTNIKKHVLIPQPLNGTQAIPIPLP